MRFGRDAGGEGLVKVGVVEWGDGEGRVLSRYMQTARSCQMRSHSKQRQKRLGNCRCNILISAVILYTSISSQRRTVSVVSDFIHISISSTKRVGVAINSTKVKVRYLKEIKQKGKRPKTRRNTEFTTERSNKAGPKPSFKYIQIVKMYMFCT
jgi:hypothetical protein